MLPIPNLDDRTYEQLLEEAKKLIPNYAPEWTNYNPADPGITLIELFSWLTELLGYRINLVTDEHCLKYLKLLGFRPLGPVPAVVDLTFEAEKQLPLEKGTSFLAEKAGEGIEFELLEAITVFPFRLRKIIANEMEENSDLDFSPDSSHARKFAKGIFDRTVANSKEDLFFAPFGLDCRENSELYLGFELKGWESGRKIPDSLSFMCYLYEKDLIEPGRHGEEAEYEFENAKLKWEISVSREGKQWKEIFPTDETKNFRKNGKFQFTGLESWVCSSTDVQPPGEKNSREKYFWLRCTLISSEYEYPPRIEKISLNTTIAFQKKKVNELLLGKSSGIPEQVFKLPKTPVLRGSLKLKIGGELWEEVEDFDGSGPKSPDFTIDSQTGELRFGDGLRGKVPQKDAEVLVLEYETCRGKEGNLPAGSNWAVEGGTRDEKLTINNFKPAAGGQDEEESYEATTRFLQDLKVPYSAVTSKDFEWIAKATPGLRVAQAKAVPNFDPADPAGGEGCVTVVVIPFSPLERFDHPPVPSAGFMKAVTRHLEKHRLLGTRVQVVAPEYVQVQVKVSISLSKGFSEKEVKKALLTKLKLFLHPAKGGNAGDGWPVGKPVYRSELYRLIMESEGVNSVREITINAGKGGKLDENGDLILDSRTATVYSGKHSIEIRENGR